LTAHPDGQRCQRIKAGDDMSAVYRQKTFDGPLKPVTDHVRDWLLGATCIE
jgi:hypothetical protein